MITVRNMAAAAGGAAPLVPGEYPLTAADFTRIAALLQRETGIHLPTWKAALVYSRLVKRVRALGMGSFRDYCELLSRDDGNDERGRMCSALTTNVTRFFREPHHFEHLRSVALPPLLEAARRGARVRLWSAASSSGQEPYSIAMTILSLMPDAGRFDIRVLATDINPQMVAEGRAAIYDEAEFETVPAALRSRWFAQAAPGKLQAVEELRALVAFRELNLIGSWPFKGPFDAVFCRNVVIYFDAETQAAIWSRIAAVLPQGSWLYIGHSERVTGPTAAVLQSAGITTYRRDGGRA
jgi:chemotaxis protein methyltransferase CheR